jgi:hypothetical protein
MKLLFTILVFIYGSCAMSQNSSHPTISSVRVINKSTPTSTVVVDGKYQFKTSPEVTVTIKNMNDVSKVSMEILKKDSSSVYKVEYNISSQVVIENNIKLFEVNNNQIFIAGPQNINRETYIYKFFTTNGNNTSGYFFTNN